MTPRIAPLSDDRVTPPAGELLREAKRKLGMVPNAYRVMANAPAALAGYTALASALDGGVLPKRLREQIALAIAARNGCDYCLAAHRIGAKFARLSADEIEAAERGHAANRQEAAALALAVDLLDMVGDANDAVLADARAAGLSDEALVEIAAHVAANLFTNTINRFARTPNDFAGRGIRVAADLLSRFSRG